MLQSLNASISYTPQYTNHIAAAHLHASDEATSPVDTQTPEAVTAPPATDTDTAENHTPAGQLSVELVTALQEDDTTAPEAEATTAPPPPPPPAEAQTTDADDAISEAEEAQIDTLEARDQEVRTHEQAHAIAGGAYASSPSYEYQTGPDGRQYAIGGEVQIDTAPIAGDPSATIAKMDTVIRAALAPAEPSSQDRAVAAMASKQRVEAQAEINAEKAAKLSGDDENATGDPATGAAAASQEADPIINLFA